MILAQAIGRRTDAMPNEPSLFVARVAYTLLLHDLAIINLNAQPFSIAMPARSDTIPALL